MSAHLSHDRDAQPADVPAAGTRRNHDGQIPRSYQCSGLRPRTCPDLSRPWEGHLTEERNLRQKMNGRYFARRKIEAYLFDGKERFKKSGHSQLQEDGGEADEEERLADFESWLMAEGESN